MKERLRLKSPPTREFNASVSLSRDTQGQINIRINDADASVSVLHLTLTDKQFAKFMFSQFQEDVKATLYGTVKHVGKRRVVQFRKVRYPNFAHDDRANMEAWLQTHKQETGWILDPSLASSTSVTLDGSDAYLNYRVFRYEDIPK